MRNSERSTRLEKQFQTYMAEAPKDLTKESQNHFAFLALVNSEPSSVCQELIDPSLKYKYFTHDVSNSFALDENAYERPLRLDEAKEFMECAWAFTGKKPENMDEAYDTIYNTLGLLSPSNLDKEILLNKKATLVLSQPSLVHEVERGFLKEELLDIVSQFPFPVGKAIIARFGLIDGKPKVVSEIGAELEISVAQTRSALRKGMELLGRYKDILKDYLE